MRLVVDANRIFAALLRDSTTRKILVERELNFYTPQFAIEEIFEHIDELQAKTGLSKAVITQKLEELITLSEIHIISPVETKPFLKEAKEISPDPDDEEYVALALKMNCPIWSEDKELKAIKKVEVINTKELMREGDLHEKKYC
jgi:predicted nucleic acid-binding protein